MRASRAALVDLPRAIDARARVITTDFDECVHTTTTGAYVDSDGREYGAGQPLRTAWASRCFALGVKLLVMSITERNPVVARTAPRKIWAFPCCRPREKRTVCCATG
ncbi:hypothetical protein [Nonomuraea dietziae]|uniref:hypothetical protein n=1 Tax=Nonomuraea dietziae TaxID=65515 RepID=UPI0031D740B5